MKTHNLKETLRKHKKLVAGVLVLAVCVGAGTVMEDHFPQHRLTSGSGDIPKHDGDVLVDSLQVQEETAGETRPENGTGSGSAQAAAKAGKEEAADKADKTAGPKKDSLVTSDDVSDLENADTYFEEMRATINMDRNQVISMLTDAETSAASATEKETANQQKMKILQYMEQEQNVENAIAAKGLPACLVLITDSGVNVTVNKQELNQSDVAKICDVVMRETGRKAPDIVVQSKY